MRIPGLGHSDEQLVAFAQLGVNELVKRDSAVHYVSLSQARSVLESLEVFAGLRNQGNGNPLS